MDNLQGQQSSSAPSGDIIDLSNSSAQFKVPGLDKPVSAADLAAGWMRHEDYTRKRQAEAERLRQAEAAAEEARMFAEWLTSNPREALLTLEERLRAAGQLDEPVFQPPSAAPSKDGKNGGMGNLEELIQQAVARIEDRVNSIESRFTDFASRSALNADMATLMRQDPSMSDPARMTKVMQEAGRARVPLADARKLAFFDELVEEVARLRDEVATYKRKEEMPFLFGKSSAPVGSGKPDNDPMKALEEIFNATAAKMLNGS